MICLLLVDKISKGTETELVYEHLVSCLLKEVGGEENGAGKDNS